MCLRESNHGYGSDLSLRIRGAVYPSELIVGLAGGRRIATPLEWYPRLAKASGAQRENYEISPLGIHWPDIDEDLSVAGMLKAQRAK